MVDTLLAQACKAVSCSVDDVASWREYEDRVVIVLSSGPKHSILKADIPASKPTRKPAPKPKPPTRRPRSK